MACKSRNGILFPTGLHTQSTARIQESMTALGAEEPDECHNCNTAFVSVIEKPTRAVMSTTMAHILAVALYCVSLSSDAMPSSQVYSPFVFLSQVKRVRIRRVIIETVTRKIIPVLMLVKMREMLAMMAEERNDKSQTQEEK